jgi:hypothetical protein
MPSLSLLPPSPLTYLRALHSSATPFCLLPYVVRVSDPEAGDSGPLLNTLEPEYR